MDGKFFPRVMAVEQPGDEGLAKRGESGGVGDFGLRVEHP
jgi:hypothetical protein